MDLPPRDWLFETSTHVQRQKVILERKLIEAQKIFGNEG